MGVEINEPRCDDQATRIDRSRCDERIFANEGDRFAADADVANRIESRGRVDDAPAANDEIEGAELGIRRFRRDARGQAEKEGEGDHV